MREVSPEVFLVARPEIDWGQIGQYLKAVGGEDWLEQLPVASDGGDLVEFMGRLCYRSWKPGLNPNVKKIRTDSVEYLLNLLASRHGSPLEHVNYSFVFHNVSRVFTHELVRHRAGVAISQESLRFVRLTDIPFEHPKFVQEDPYLLERANQLLESMENFQGLLARHTGIDEDGVPFSKKKEITSGMRRYAPDGLATSIGWTANIRTLRHVISMRTALGAEDEIRRVFDMVGHIMVKEVPALFSDFVRTDDGAWVPQYEKV